MLEKIPTDEELNQLMGEDIYKSYHAINKFIKDNYDMDILWDNGGKTGIYELKYRKSGKTFCALYPREKGMRILIIFGKIEQEKFESARGDFSEYICSFYDNTHQYHDGKWLYLDVINGSAIEDIEKLLLIKKKPNRKGANLKESDTEAFEKSLKVMNELFAKDYQFALATVNNNIPSIRFVDTYFDNGCFYIVTYAKSKKVKELEINNNVSLCNKLYNFQGIAYNLGHPLKLHNCEIREKLIGAFEPWYFKHNNENDENMCYIKVELTYGFFYKDGTGFKVDFTAKKAKQFPFEFDIVTIE